MHVSHCHPSMSTLRHSWMLRVWVCKRRVNSRRLSSLPCLWLVLTPPAWVPAGINAQVVNHKLLLWWLRHKLPPLTTDNGLQCRGGSMSSFRSLVRSQIDLTFLISLLIDSICSSVVFVTCYPNATTLRSGLCYRKSVCLSSVVYLKRSCAVLRGLKLSAIFLHRCVHWPDLCAKFYGDRPKAAPPSGALSTRRVTK